MVIRCLVITCGMALTLNGASKDAAKVRVTGVSVQLSSSPQQHGQLHWKITNSSPSEVYVYSFFLYGPAYGTKDKEGKKVFDTVPTAQEGGCPNRFPPVLLLRVPAGDYREGDFRDPVLRGLSGKTASIKIGVGPEPYTVVDEAHRIRWESKSCVKSPYDAIFEWSTIQESNAVQVP